MTYRGNQMPLTHPMMQPREPVPQKILVLRVRHDDLNDPDTIRLFAAGDREKAFLEFQELVEYAGGKAPGEENDPGGDIEVTHEDSLLCISLYEQELE